MTALPSFASMVIICGPTATGKTALAFNLAQQFGGAIVAADSRQVYVDMDIGTGKDIPASAVLHRSRLQFDRQPITYYQAGHIDIWGYDIVPPTYPFTAMDYYAYAWKVLPYLWKKRVLPFLVGGTGLYLDTVTQPPATGGIVPNPDLRQELAQKSLAHLQAQLVSLDPFKFTHMNHSDRHNPRRLIRAIEVALNAHQRVKAKKVNHTPNVLWIGTTLDQKLLHSRIQARVLARATPEFDQELAHLVQKYPDFGQLPASSATGYREWLQYKQQAISRTEAIALWTKREQQYAKRQRTWFQKNPAIRWFNIDHRQLYQSIAQTIETWYANANARKTV